MGELALLASPWTAKLLGVVREETVFRTAIILRCEMRQAVVDAIGGWRAERAFAGTKWDTAGAEDRIKIGRRG